MSALLDKLKKYSESDALPMHMPGHKRNENAFPWLSELGSKLDITEIDGFDNLNDPQEFFKDIEMRASKLWGADESICLVNGSTAGVLAAVRTALERGGEFLMARGSHRSVYHAAEITGAKTHYLLPEIHASGIWGAVSAGDIAKILDSNTNIRLVAITSPTYEGVISDVRAISEVCHARGVPLFVDEAHGAHLGFGDFPESAVKCGADIVVQSLHKTLPSLTQTAILHVNNGIIDSKDVRRNAAMFQSSSPSYLLSASICGCIEYLESEGEQAADRWLDALKSFYESTSALQNLHIRNNSDFCIDAVLDPSKIIVYTAGTDLSAAELMGIMRSTFNIELEMAAEDYALAMTGMGDTKETLMRLSEALHEIDNMCRKKGGTTSNIQPEAKHFTIPERRLSIREAVNSDGEFYDIASAEGKISGEYVWAYPPGIPLTVPGEVITADGIKAIVSGVNIHSTYGKVPERIFCAVKY